MRNRLYILALLIMACGLARGQATRFDYSATTVQGTGQQLPVLALPYASVSFYTGCTSLPCSTLATTYANALATNACPTGAQVNVQLSTACQGTADAEGNFGGWFVAGQYQYVITFNGVSYGPYYFTVGYTPGTDYGFIQSVPIVGQNVSQPSGTTLTVNSINGVFEATGFAGSDIGAKVNAAIAALNGACGTVTIAPGSYSFATQIIKPMCVTIEGNNASLTWTNTSATIPAMVIGSATRPNYTWGGINNLFLYGNATAPGVFLGGQAGSYSVPAGLSEFQEGFSSFMVEGFLDNFVKGANVYQISFFGGGSANSAYSNWLDLGAGSENMMFFGWQSLNSAGWGFYGAAMGGSEFKFVNCSWDYNAVGMIYMGDGTVDISGGHMEGPAFPFIDGPASSALGFSEVLTISNGLTLVGAYTSSVTSFFRIRGYDSSVVIEPGMMIYTPSVTVAELVDWEATGASNSLVVGTYMNPTSPAGVNIPAVQSGANIQWLDIPQFNQYVATGNYKTAETVSTATMNAITNTTHPGTVGSTANGCQSPTVNVDLPYEGNFLGWNCDTTGGADFYNPFVNNTNIAAFHFKTKLADGAWTDVAMISRGGDLHVSNIYGTTIAPIPGTTAPSGTCINYSPGALMITADGHASYCHAGTIIWTTLY